MIFVFFFYAVRECYHRVEIGSAERSHHENGSKDRCSCLSIYLFRVYCACKSESEEKNGDKLGSKNLLVGCFVHDAIFGVVKVTEYAVF